MGSGLQRIAENGRLYRAAQVTAHGARVFASSVFLALLFVHVNEGAGVVAPLALASAGVILTPAALEAVRARR